MSRGARLPARRAGAGPARARGAARAVCAALALALAAACARAPLNEPLARPLGRDEILRERPRAAANGEDLLLVLAFSGGGARAAALSYGVLEALRDTRVTGPDGAPRRLLDDVDLVTAVSGGSFTAAAFALQGDALFAGFERDFLRRPVQRALWLRALAPWNWARLASPAFGRSDLAAELYDDLLFRGATFGSLFDRPGPWLAIQATDLEAGTRFGFSHHQFALICSELRALPIARAVAASAAFPVLLSPITLRNYGEGCGQPEPPWIAEALAGPDRSGRRYRNALHARRYREAGARRWIHLVDGGVSDNLGLHRLLDAIVLRDDLDDLLRDRGFPRARRIAYVIVNAQVGPRESAMQRAPGVGDLLSAVTAIQIRRYNFESIELLRRVLGDRVEARRAAGGPPIDTYVVEVAFDGAPDPEERRALGRIPTGLQLEDAQVDRLRRAARTLLRASPDFARLVADLGGTLPGPEPAPFTAPGR